MIWTPLIQSQHCEKTWIRVFLRHGKSGVSGEERFNTLFLDRKKAAFIYPTDALPEDVTLINLNAYNIWFCNSVDKILKQSEATMRKIIDEFNLDMVQGICIVSTCYVQQPEPYKCTNHNHIPSNSTMINIEPYYLEGSY